MSKELTYDERKEWAKELYTELDHSCRDVALKVGMDEAIVRQWIKAHGWEGIKRSMLLSKTRQLEVLYAQLDMLTHGLGENEKLSAKDVDAYSRCIAHINALEPFPSISDFIEIFDLFLRWLRKTDLILAQEVVVYLDAFLEERIAA